MSYESVIKVETTYQYLNIIKQKVTDKNLPKHCNHHSTSRPKHHDSSRVLPSRRHASIR